MFAPLKARARLYFPLKLKNYLSEKDSQEGLCCEVTQRLVIIYLFFIIFF